MTNKVVSLYTKLSRRAVLGCAGAIVAMPASTKITHAKINYRGFIVDMSAVQDSLNFSAVESLIKHQIDIVADCGAKPEILNFFAPRKLR